MKILFFISAVFSVLILSPFDSSAGYPGDFRVQEQKLKAAQARSVRARVGTSPRESQVTVDLYDFDLKVLHKEAKVVGALTAVVRFKEPTQAYSFDAAGLRIKRVLLSFIDGIYSEASFRVHDRAVDVEFGRLVAIEEKVSVRFEYEVQGEFKTSLWGHEPTALNFVEGSSDRAPAVYTSTEPDLSPTWFPCIDDPAVKAKEVLFRVAVRKGWYALSNGELLRRESLPPSSEDPEGYEVFSWHEHFPIPTYLISLAAAPYVSIKSASVLAGEAKREIPLETFVPKNLEQDAKNDVALFAPTLSFYSQVFEPYPFEKLSMAVVPFYSGAMEHTTAITLADTMISGMRESEETIAHEIAHHWWGDSVTNATWDDLWLNEGFATFSELLFVEEFRDPEEAKLYRKQMLSHYLIYDPNQSKSVVDEATAPGEKFNSATYEKGGLVLAMLRDEIGQEKLIEVFREYLRRFRFKNAGTADFKKTLEDVTKKSFSKFFEQWIYGRGYPVLESGWRFLADGEVELSLVQKQTHAIFEFGLEVEFRTESERVVEKVWIDKARGVFRFKPLFHSGQKIQAVLIDPESKIIHK